MNINDYNKVTDRLTPSERCRNEVLNMNKRRKKHIKLNKRGIAAVVATAIAACGGTVVFAADKLGIFDRLSNNLSGSYVDERGNEWKKDKYEHHDFEEINKAAQTFTSPIPLEGKDISITVESVYCDGNTMILGLSGSLNNGNPEGFQYIPFDTIIKKDGKTYSRSLNKGYIDMKSMLYLDEGTENSFSGQFLIVFNNKDKIKEAADMEFRFHLFKPNSNFYGAPEDINGCDTPALEDDFNFMLNIAPDENIARHINHTFTDKDGYSVTIFDITPAATQIQVWNMPEAEEHDCPYKQENPDSKVFDIWTDGNGKVLEKIETYMPLMRDDGTFAAFCQPPTSDIINIKYYDAITPDENGEPLFIHEMTIDLENLTVIE